MFILFEKKNLDSNLIYIIYEYLKYYNCYKFIKRKTILDENNEIAGYYLNKNKLLISLSNGLFYKYDPIKDQLTEYFKMEKHEKILAINIIIFIYINPAKLIKLIKIFRKKNVYHVIQIYMNFIAIINIYST